MSDQDEDFSFELYGGKKYDSAGVEIPAPAGDPAEMSPTIRDIPKHERPAPLPICALCPNALWLKAGNALLCYCRLMHRDVFDTKNQNLAAVENCDGLEISEAQTYQLELDPAASAGPAPENKP